jgi:hypothetical protein
MEIEQMKEKYGKFLKIVLYSFINLHKPNVLLQLKSLGYNYSYYNKMEN